MSKRVAPVPIPDPGSYEPDPPYQYERYAQPQYAPNPNNHHETDLRSDSGASDIKVKRMSKFAIGSIASLIGIIMLAIATAVVIIFLHQSDTHNTLISNPSSSSATFQTVTITPTSSSSTGNTSGSGTSTPYSSTTSAVPTCTAGDYNTGKELHLLDTTYDTAMVAAIAQNGGDELEGTDRNLDVALESIFLCNSEPPQLAFVRTSPLT